MNSLRTWELNASVRNIPASQCWQKGQETREWFYQLTIESIKSALVVYQNKSTDSMEAGQSTYIYQSVCAAASEMRTSRKYSLPRTCLRWAMFHAKLVQCLLVGGFCCCHSYWLLEHTFIGSRADSINPYGDAATFNAVSVVSVNKCRC